MAVDDLSAQKDALVWNNLDWAVSQATGPIGDLKKHKVWHELDPNEEIRIVEHGAKTGGLGETSTNDPLKPTETRLVQADDIVSSMLSTPNELPANPQIGGITFQSCYAGLGASTSLVSKMAGALKTAGLPGVKVKGRTGIAFGFKGMGEATAESAMVRLPTATGSHVDLEKGNWVYSWLVKNEGVAGQKWDDSKGAYESWVWKGKVSSRPIFANGWYAKPWDIVGKTESEWNTASGSWKATPEQKAQSVADEMEDWWAYLSARMKAYGGFKTSDEEYEEVSKA